MKVVAMIVLCGCGTEPGIQNAQLFVPTAPHGCADAFTMLGDKACWVSTKPVDNAELQGLMDIAVREFLHHYPEAADSKESVYARMTLAPLRIYFIDGSGTLGVTKNQSIRLVWATPLANTALVHEMQHYLAQLYSELEINPDHSNAELFISGYVGSRYANFASAENIGNYRAHDIYMPEAVETWTTDAAGVHHRVSAYQWHYFTIDECTSDATCPIGLIENYTTGRIDKYGVTVTN